MIIYIPNDDVARIAGYIKHCVLRMNPAPSEAEALERMLKQIDYEKKGKPYQMWLSNKEERHVEDSVAGAGGVVTPGAAGGNRVRKNRAQKRRR